ncbi:MAG TPA: TauD/TfdA family dioxygenase [Gammaproteobacteria bacterium]|nr:TauD/TfdA family dioxygenase [Gammaproteobacteria bacterium]
MLRSLSLDLPAIEQPSAVAAALSRALGAAKVVHFRTAPFETGTLDRWQNIAGRIGPLMMNGEDSATGAPDGALWMDVSYQPDKAYTFRHSSTAQPLHTDDAYKDAGQSARYVLFLVERAAGDGGETYFVDAAELAGFAREREPALFAALTSLPVCFAKHGIGKTVPILAADRDDWEVTWNYYRVDPHSPAEVIELRDRFHAWLATPEVRDRLAYGFRLGRDEGVVWQDRKVLHGRTAFVAERAGERCIWKCCIG